MCAKYQEKPYTLHTKCKIAQTFQGGKMESEFVMNKYLQNWFIKSAIGYVPSQDVLPNIKERINREVSMHRQGQLVHIMSEFLVRSNSNILCKRQEFFEPISVQDLGEVLKIKEDALRNFMKDMVKLDNIKIVNKCIYVNPTYAISYEMDYIRQELIDMFPKDKEQFEIINTFLKGEHGLRE